MACKFIPRKPKPAITPTLSDQDLVKFLVEDHVGRISCRKVAVKASSSADVVRDDITLPQKEKDPTEIFDFFYDPITAAAKLDVLADLEPSIISKSASVTNSNVTDRRSKAKRK